MVSPASSRNPAKKVTRMRGKAAALSICVLTGATTFLSPSIAFAAELPAQPTVNDACGTATDTVTLPETAGVTWYLGDQVVAGTVSSGGALSQTFTATTAENDSFPGGATSQNYAVEYTNLDCSQVIAVVAATFNDVSGTQNDTVIIPSSEGTEYLVNGVVTAAGTYPGMGNVVVEARALPGYTFASGSQTIFERLFSAEADAVLVTPLAPAFGDARGTANDTVEIPAQDGVVYTVNSEVRGAGVYPALGNTVVNAAPAEGYAFPQGTQNTWSYDFTEAAVITVTPEAPTFSDVSGTANDTVTIPAQTGVRYLLNGTLVAPGVTPVSGTVNVTAQAEAGYAFTEGSQTSFDRVYSGNTITAPEAPVFTDLSGNADDTYEIPSVVGVEYTVNDVATPAGTYPAPSGAVVIRAIAQEGYEFAADTKTEFTENFSGNVVIELINPPTFVEETGTANDSYTIPETEGVNYLVDGVVAPAGTYPAPADGTVTIVLEAQAGYEFDPSVETEYSQIFSDAVNTVITPTAPTFNDLSGSENDTYVIPEVEGVDYYVDGGLQAAGTYDGVGTVIVEAIAQEGFEFTVGAQTTFTEVFDADVVLETVVPERPTFTDNPGVEDDTYTIPTVEGVSYFIGDAEVAAGEYDGRGTVNIVAVADEGFVFPEGTDATYDYTFSAVELTVVTPVSPVFTDESGTADDVIVIPTTEGIDYTIDGEVVTGTIDGRGTVQVVAVPQDGFAFADGTRDTFDFTFSEVVADIVVAPVAPSFIDASGTADDVIVIPAQQDGVEYLIDGEVVAAGEYDGLGEVLVTVRATDGYAFADGTQTDYPFTFSDAVQATVVSPAAPTFVDVSGTANDTYTIPAVEGVEYVIDGEVVAAGEYDGLGSVTITVRAIEGYVLAENTKTEYTQDFNANVVVTPVAPTFVDEVGTANDTYTIPSVEGVSYFIGDAEVEAGTYDAIGTVVITAVADEGFEFPTGTTTTFTEEFAGIVTVTPKNVVFNDRSGADNDSYVIPEVEGVNYLVDGEVVTAGEYETTGTVVVTVEAQEGYVLAEGAPTEFTETFETTVNVEVVAPTVTKDNVVTIPEVEGLEYSLNGEVVTAGEYTITENSVVTVRVLDGFAVPEDADLSFDLAFTPEEVTPPVVTPPVDETPVTPPVDEAPVDEAPVTTPVVVTPVTPLLPVAPVLEVPDVSTTPNFTDNSGTNGGLVSDDFTSTDNGDLADTGANPNTVALFGAGGLLAALGAALMSMGRRRKA